MAGGRLENLVAADRLGEEELAGRDCVFKQRRRVARPPLAGDLLLLIAAKGMCHEEATHFLRS